MDLFSVYSGNAKNDDLLFPSLLPSMLSCLKGSSENQLVSRSQYCVVVWNFLLLAKAFVDLNMLPWV